MQILIIDNSLDPTSWGASELCALARLADGGTIRVRRGPQEDLPSDPLAFDRIVVSGSRMPAEEQAPWTQNLDTFIRRAVDESRPLLGVCYGHQAIARALGGAKHVRRAARGEFGWVRIENAESQAGLLRGLPRAFHSFQWHNDEVCELPTGMKLLARSEVCPIQACVLEGKPVFGVQFHPERTLERGEQALAKRFKENPKAECSNRGRGEKLYDAKIGETIFRNFLLLENE